MEYLVILALSFFEEPDLKFYNFKNIKFNNLETCETFITSKADMLKYSMQFQFNQEGKVNNYIISCWSSKEWNKYLDSIFKMDI